MKRSREILTQLPRSLACAVSCWNKTLLSWKVAVRARSPVHRTASRPSSPRRHFMSPPCVCRRVCTTFGRGGRKQQVSAPGGQEAPLPRQVLRGLLSGGRVPRWRVGRGPRGPWDLPSVQEAALLLQPRPLLTHRHRPRDGRAPCPGGNGGRKCLLSRRPEGARERLLSFRLWSRQRARPNSEVSAPCGRRPGSPRRAPPLTLKSPAWSEPDPICGIPCPQRPLLVSCAQSHHATGPLQPQRGPLLWGQAGPPTSGRSRF